MDDFVGRAVASCRIKAMVRPRLTSTGRFELPDRYSDLAAILSPQRNCPAAEQRGERRYAADPLDT
ncbi:MAG TPA: hypothetical protein VFQ89_01585, partial [Candidatus Binatia bacterium]|nr:hypothetical protein [Candidatus Binatia bacterium]